MLRQRRERPDALLVAHAQPEKVHPEVAGGRADYGHNEAMLSPLDTSEHVARLQQDLWRDMSPLAKLQLASGLTLAARELCLAGIRSRYPGASEHEVTLRFALITLGADLAAKAYPDAAAL